MTDPKSVTIIGRHTTAPNHESVLNKQIEQLYSLGYRSFYVSYLTNTDQYITNHLIELNYPDIEIIIVLPRYKFPETYFVPKRYTRIIEVPCSTIDDDWNEEQKGSMQYSYAIHNVWQEYFIHNSSKIYYFRTDTDDIDEDPTDYLCEKAEVDDSFEFHIFGENLRNKNFLTIFLENGTQFILP